MTPETFKAIRERSGRGEKLSQSELAAFLRISDMRTIRRWETGVVPVSGPATFLMELLDVGTIKTGGAD